MKRRQEKGSVSIVIDDLAAEHRSILAQIEALKNKAEGLAFAITIAQRRKTETAIEAADKKPGNTKALLVELLKECGSTGLNANSAVDLAAARGETLLRATAASILSRMKSDSIVIHDGDRYRLPEFTRQPSLAAIAGGKTT